MGEGDADKIVRLMQPGLEKSRWQPMGARAWPGQSDRPPGIRALLVSGRQLRATSVSAGRLAEAVAHRARGQGVAEPQHRPELRPCAVHLG